MTETQFQKWWKKFAARHADVAAKVQNLKNTDDVIACWVEQMRDLDYDRAIEAINCLKPKVYESADVPCAVVAWCKRREEDIREKRERLNQQRDYQQSGGAYAIIHNNPQMAAATKEVGRVIRHYEKQGHSREESIRLQKQNMDWKKYGFDPWQDYMRNGL